MLFLPISVQVTKTWEPIKPGKTAPFTIAYPKLEAISVITDNNKCSPTPFLWPKNIYHPLKKSMKNKTFRLLGLSTVFATVLTIGFTSCKKDKDANSPALGMSATIGTTAFKPKAVVATLQNGYIEVVGGAVMPSDSLVIEVLFQDTAKLNTKLTFAQAEIEMATINTSKLYDSSDPRSHGSVTVTTLDKTNKKVAGKFEGVIYDAFGGNDSLVVKDGTFNTTYIAY
ncbi:hypothetical protein A4D02_00130 [Niastella koreensis]|nr:hypothetical protein A4D02_00130 [Niastella koreensis]